jgi:ATP-dependent Lon protease
MAKNSIFNKMPRSDKSKLASRKKLRKNSSDDSDGHESDSSIDSHGNIRDLIDYGSEDDERPPTRKASINARKQINKILKREDAMKKRQLKEAEKEFTKLAKNTIHHPAAKSKEISRSKERSSHTSKPRHRVIEDTEEEEDIEETENEEEDEMEVDDEATEYEDDDEEVEEEEDVDMEEDDEEDEDYEEEDGNVMPISIVIGGRSTKDDSMVPKKYNLKKEPERVRNFVKLLTTPVEDGGIDSQIDQFKAMTDEKQKELITALENRPSATNNQFDLMLNILTLKVPKEIQANILAKYNSLQGMDSSTNEYYKLRAWLEKVVSIPFGVYKDIPVRIDDGPEKCTEFMKTAKKYLDESVYGQDESKLQIMQFISSKIANPNSRGLCLLLIGPPGIGKTTLIKNGIAKALGWPFQFISLGGDSDASTYTGHQLVYESSHCGKIVNSLVASKSMSTVLMFDEVDKISQTPKGEEVMNLLIHLTDPVQNGDFEDKYLSGVPIDLSKVMFVFSANDINKIDKVLLDRMLVIDLKGYDLKQKTVIAEQYLLPTALKEVNLQEKVAISKEILVKVIEDYAKEEKGVRELKRSIEQMTQKINMLRMYNSPDLPFHIKDFSLPFIVKKEHVPLFIKKKESDPLPHGMYL